MSSSSGCELKYECSSSMQFELSSEAEELGSDVGRLLQFRITTPICLCDWRKEILLIGVASRGAFHAMRGALS